MRSSSANARALWQANETSITVTGRTYPLELFLEQLNFEKEGDAFMFLSTAERTIESMMTDLMRLTQTWGWHMHVAPVAA